MQTILIKSNGSWKMIEQKDFSLEDYQKIVGGWVEYVHVYDDIAMFCNEEGKIKNLPVNNIATQYIKSKQPFDDVICGDVIFSKTDEEGEDVDLTLEEINDVIDFIETYQNLND